MVCIYIFLCNAYFITSQLCETVQALFRADFRLSAIADL